MKKLLVSALLLLLLLLLAACAGGGEPGDTTAAVTTTAVGDATTTGGEETTAPVTTTAPLTGSELLAALSPYITLSREDYYGLSVGVSLPPSISDADVEEYIEELLLGYAEYEELSEGTVAIGDEVSIYYRGEVNTDGGWVEFVGGSNLHDVTPYPLVIGSGAFIPGFEEGLVGLAVGSTSLTASTSSSLVANSLENSIVFVRYNYRYTVDDEEITGSFSDRIDLAATAGRYADSALPAALLGKSVGAELGGPYFATFDIDGDLIPEELTITEARLTKIVTEEDAFCLTVRFPDNYHAALAGKEARFYVVVETVSRPVPPTLTYELLTDKMGLSAEVLTPFIPEDAVGAEEERLLLAFRPYLKDAMEKSLAEEIRVAAINAFWLRMDGIAVTSYPEGLVSDKVRELRSMVNEAYEQYIYYYGSGTAYNDFVYSYFGSTLLPEGMTDVEEMLLHVARREVKSRLILYYIAAADGRELTEVERTDGYESYMQEMADEYSAYYGYTITKEDLVNAGYTKEYALEDMLREKVEDALFDSMREHIVYEEE